MSNFTFYLKKLLKKIFSIILFLTFCSLIAQNQPPTVTASGDIVYCPLGQANIVSDFNIVDPDDTTVEAVYIQISSGYVQGEDLLLLTGSHPIIQTSWDSQQGELTLTGIGNTPIAINEVVAAVYDVVFQSSSAGVFGNKGFSFTIGQANFLPSNGHYYEYVPALGITWTDAFAAANSMTYFGLQGYLATVTSAEEAQIVGEQAEDTGWIGGSDEETEGVWKWMNGPENGLVFWNGGVNGSTPNFAFWNNGEPNNFGDEDYVHITSPNLTNAIPGSWNDLPNQGDVGDYFPQGYIVEYGGTIGDPDINISASTSLTIPSIINFTGDAGCGNTTFTISASASIGNVLWFNQPIGGTPIAIGETFTTPVINSTTIYYALASVNGCLEGARQPVEVSINPSPEILTSVILKNCDEDGTLDGITNFNLEEINDEILISGNTDEYSYSYHLTINDAELNNNAFPPIPFENTVPSVFVRVESSNGCFSICEIQLEVSTTTIPTNFVVNLTACDDDLDGISTFDLTQATQQFLDLFPVSQNLSVDYYSNLNDAELEQNEITDVTTYLNINPFNETLFVRVEDTANNDCVGIGPHLILSVYQKPEVSLLPTDILCFDGDSVLLEVENPNSSYSYNWFNSNNEIIGVGDSITVSLAGNYSVVAISPENCESNPESITVEASAIATINSQDIIVTELLNSNSIEIVTSNLGIGDYEFSLFDFSSYQDEPIFYDIPAGEYSIKVRDKNGCGVTEIDVFILGYPSFFTPNNDGYNDTWNLKGFNSRYTYRSTIHIFDRYGKLLKEINPFGSGWDGTFNGIPLPNSDYWFVVDLEDINGNIKTIKGNFTLKR